MDSPQQRATSPGIPMPRHPKHPHSQVGAQHVSDVAQNVAKNVIAHSTGKKRHDPPEPSAESVAAAVMEPTAEEFAEQEADANWVAGLHSSHTGRKLCDFLGHVNSVLDDALGIECPIDQAVTFRRVLIRALEHNPEPFGLPKKLPKYIAMVQLCGERMLMYTDRSQLFSLMAHNVSNKRSNSEAISAMVNMIKYREEQAPEASLLLTYSAPFQIDLQHLWWDVRTLVRDPRTLKVTDGQMAYQIGQTKCRAIGCTSALESAEAAQTLDREVEAYKQNITAIDLDIEFMPSELSGVPGIMSEQTLKKIETLEGLLARMQTDRKKMLEKHGADMEELRKGKDAAIQAAEEGARMAYANERDQEEDLNRQINKLAKDVESALLECSRYKEENLHLKKTFKADTNMKIQTQAAEIEKLKSQLRLLEGSQKESEKKLTQSNKARETALKKQEAAHAKSMDDMERKLQKATMSERSAKQEAEDYMARLTALSAAMEGRDSEQELLQHDLKKAKAASRVLRGFLALAGIRSTDGAVNLIVAPVLKALDEANGKLKVNELAAGQNSIEIKKLQDAVGDREAERDSLGEANARLQARVEELEARAPVAPVAPAAPEKADAETMTVPITSEADLKIGELETKCVKIGDELLVKQNEVVQLKAELAKAKSKTGKKGAVQPAAYEDPVMGMPANGQANSAYNQVVNVHVGNGAANTDMGHATDTDPSVEHLIGNAANALRVLADMSRECSRHKAAAHEGWAQLRALQGTQQMYQQPQWQMAPHGQHPGNGYHMGM